jgi:hypothetical protein
MGTYDAVDMVVVGHGVGLSLARWSAKVLDFDGLRQRAVVLLPVGEDDHASFICTRLRQRGLPSTLFRYYSLLLLI